jgi:hypothetical protein
MTRVMRLGSPYWKKKLNSQPIQYWKMKLIIIFFWKKDLKKKKQNEDQTDNKKKQNEDQSDNKKIPRANPCFTSYSLNISLKLLTLVWNEIL